MIGKRLVDRPAGWARGRRGAAAAEAAAALLSWALWLWLPAGAAAQELARDPARFKGWEVQGVEIRGLPDRSLVRQIRQGIYMVGTKFLFFRDYPEFYPQALQEDILRIRLFLARQGYPYAQVEAGFEPNRKASKVKVIFEIEPGPVVNVGGITLSGVPDGDRRDRSLPLRGAERFNEPDLQRSIDRLIDELRRRGHAQAEVDGTVTPTVSTTVRVEFEARPGEVFTWAGASVEGAHEDLRPLAVAKMNVPEGKTFHPKTIERARESLRQLGLFSAIRLSLQYPEPERVVLHASLEQRQPRSIEGSLGYWTDEQIVVRGRWVHRNLLSRGRGAMLFASYSKFRHEGGVSLWWPAILGGPTRGEAIASIQRQDEEGFLVTTTGLQTNLRYDYAYRKRLRFGVAVQRVSVSVDTPEFEDDDGLLSYFLVGWNVDTTDDRLYPATGSLAVADLEVAPPGFLTNSHYFRLESSISRYLALGSAWVLAGQVAGGIAAPLSGSTDLLPHKRFYAGGASSMRGYRRRQLGPVEVDPLSREVIPLGGEASLLGSVELRFPVLHPIMGAAFVDVGQVWGARGEVDVADLAVAVGPGLRFATPVGPVRADVGLLLTSPGPEQPRTVFHLGIGHPY